MNDDDACGGGDHFLQTQSGSGAKGSSVKGTDTTWYAVYGNPEGYDCI